MDYTEIFKALPHVNTIWVTEDGNFHLHPHNGGEEVKREDSEDSKRMQAVDVIELINSATNEAEVRELLGDDTRKGVIKAAEKKIASFEK